MADDYDKAEERVREAFRKVRNRLLKHSQEEIILACIEVLNQYPSDKIKHLVRYPPWRLLMLVKWTIIHGESFPQKQKTLTKNHFDYLQRLMQDIEACQRSPEEYEGLFLFFRNFAFQQFWLQQTLDPSVLARQSLLFNRLDESHPFKRDFSDKCGISINDFIELVTLLMTRFIQEKKISVTQSWFRTVADNYEPGAIQRFLDLLSGDVEFLKNKLKREESSARKISYEYYEQSPLKETPLFNWNSEYYPFSRELLARSIETFIYDKLRADNPNAFMNNFGPIFEQYVGNSVSKMGVPYFKEDDLREKLYGDGKVVDYLIVDGDSTIFIDAKGVEMSYLGMVSHRAGIIKHQTKDSIIKGIKQGFECAKRLQGIEKIGNIDLGKKKYLIIVTFKDLYIGNGRTFYSYEEDALDRIIAEYNDTPPVSFDNMYFMSIDDFDLLSEVVSLGKSSLSNILKKAVSDDSAFETMKFSFGQHIQSICPDCEIPVWLRDEAKRIVACCAKRFKS